MSPTNVDIHRAGHRAFNSRDFEAMTRCYADSITWTSTTLGVGHSERGRSSAQLPAGVGHGRLGHPDRPADLP